MSNNESVIHECILNGSDTRQSDLKLTNLRFKIQGDDTTTSATSGTLKIKENRDLDIYVDLKNDDDGVANSSYFEMRISQYASTSPQYSSDNFMTGNGGSIPANSSKTVSLSTYIYDYVGSIYFTNGTTYYIILDIDPNNDVDETYENNNIEIIPFKFESTSSKPPKDGGFEIQQKSSIPIESPYLISIHNFSGVKVLEKKIQNKTYENEIISNLPKGFYILNSIHGSRKIYVKE
ncbi:T9SS type A sorting domain-containing protein [Lutibacter oceani]|uniref:T9SS type A sorting domain-containing protein n=1 Tax=Lutibacter oceani TaxID=1853311 RepID=UPI0011C06449|nr:T9SS type A sorting domain-containing protein [Lutibacter oceani]